MIESITTTTQTQKKLQEELLKLSVKNIAMVTEITMADNIKEKVKTLLKLFDKYK